MGSQSLRASSAASEAAASCPAALKPLKSLGFAALAWVVLNQFRDHLGLHAGASSGIVGKGYLGADIFFIVAGFIVCQAYVGMKAQGKFSYGSFLWRGLARVYPLHLVTLAAMAGLYLAGRLSGAVFDPRAYPPAAIPANLLLIHAWGVLATDYWNFPSWLISALWFALIVFPVTAWLALKGLRPTAVAVIAPIVLFAAMFEVADARGVLFSDMTAQIGALQTVPSFLLGAALYRLGQERSLPGRWPDATALAAAAWIVVAASLRLSDLLIWPAFGVLVFAVAETAKGVRPALTARPLQYLARFTFSVFLVYLPVDIVYFRAVRLLVGAPVGVAAWAAWWGVFPVILLVGAFAFFAVERPANTWLRRHDPFQRSLGQDSG
jgi:peptidoglycan/LPS O-acetylase OafA/YrhL